MNKVPTDRKTGVLTPEQISKALKLEIQAIIPSAERPMLDSLNRGVPVIVNARQSPGREILEFIDLLRAKLQGIVDEEDDDFLGAMQDPKRKRRGLFS